MRGSSERNIPLFLFGTACVVLLANLFGKDFATLVTDIALTVSSDALLVLAVVISTRFGIRGDHGIAYFFFACFAALWLVAELTWTLSELVFQQPLDSIDWIYLGGYPFLFLFSMYYLKPLRKQISKKMIVLASLVVAAFLIPTLYTTYSYNNDASVMRLLDASIYPLADTAVLFPAVVGISLFFRGQVSFFWSLACLAIILNIIADSGFMFLYLDSAYYTGHPIDILYLWSYVLFSFGIYSHIKFFKKPKIELR